MVDEVAVIGNDHGVHPRRDDLGDHPFDIRAVHVETSEFHLCPPHLCLHVQPPLNDRRVVWSDQNRLQEQIRSFFTRTEVRRFAVSATTTSGSRRSKSAASSVDRRSTGHSRHGYQQLDGGVHARQPARRAPRGHHPTHSERSRWLAAHQRGHRALTLAPRGPIEHTENEEMFMGVLPRRGRRAACRASARAERSINPDPTCWRRISIRALAIAWSRRPASSRSISRVTRSPVAARDPASPTARTRFSTSDAPQRTLGPQGGWQHRA